AAGSDVTMREVISYNTDGTIVPTVQALDAIEAIDSKQPEGSKLAHWVNGRLDTERTDPLVLADAMLRIKDKQRQLAVDAKLKADRDALDLRQDMVTAANWKTEFAQRANAAGVTEPLQLLTMLAPGAYVPKDQRAYYEEMLSRMSAERAQPKPAIDNTREKWRADFMRRLQEAPSGVKWHEYMLKVISNINDVPIEEAEDLLKTLTQRYRERNK
ncbi:MAG: hypothetical protein VW362_12200, partial [Candidatus Nanopelagicales bacterium]